MCSACGSAMPARAREGSTGGDVGCGGGGGGGAAAPAAALAPSPLPPPGPWAGWGCASCSTWNPPAREKCAACGARVDAGLTPPVLPTGGLVGRDAWVVAAAAPTIPVPSAAVGGGPAAGACAPASAAAAVTLDELVAASRYPGTNDRHSGGAGRDVCVDAICVEASADVLRAWACTGATAWCVRAGRSARLPLSPPTHTHVDIHSRMPSPPPPTHTHFAPPRG